MKEVEQGCCGEDPSTKGMVTAEAGPPRLLGLQMVRPSERTPKIQGKIAKSPNTNIRERENSRWPPGSEADGARTR